MFATVTICNLYVMSEIKHLKAHILREKVFFYSIITRNFDDHLGSNFHNFCFASFVEIHQMKRLVFDNYQRFQVSLTENIELAINIVARSIVQIQLVKVGGLMPFLKTSIHPTFCC